MTNTEAWCHQSASNTRERWPSESQRPVRVRRSHPQQVGEPDQKFSSRATADNFTRKTEGMQGDLFYFGHEKSNQFSLPHKELHEYVAWDTLFKRAGTAARCIEQLEDTSYTMPGCTLIKKPNPNSSVGGIFYMCEGKKW